MVNRYGRISGLYLTLYYLIEQTMCLLFGRKRKIGRLYIFATRTSRKILFMMVNFTFRLELPRLLIKHYFWVC